MFTQNMNADSAKLWRVFKNYRLSNSHRMMQIEKAHLSRLLFFRVGTCALVTSDILSFSTINWPSKISNAHLPSMAAYPNYKGQISKLTHITI